MQQAVGIEGVPDARARAEGEADRGTALAQRLLALRRLFGRGAIFARQVLGNVLAFGRHLRIELEGLEMPLDRHVRPQALHGALQRIESDGAPRAGHVGDEIDLHAPVFAAATPPDMVARRQLPPCQIACLPLRADSPRHLRTPPAAVAARRLPGAGVLARIRAAAALT